MAIIKDPYEISIWGTKQEAIARKINLDDFNNINKFDVNLFSNISIKIKERKASNTIYGIKSLNIFENDTLASEIDLSRVVARGTYDTRTRVLVETHKLVEISWGEMNISTKTAPDGLQWRYTTKYIKQIDSSSLNKDQCSFSDGSWNKNAQGFYFADGKNAGYLYICMPTSTSASEKFQIVYPLKNPIVSTYEDYISFTGNSSNSFIIKGIDSSPAGSSITLNYDIYKNLNEEYRIATIGSDNLNSPFRVIEPKFTENINGTHTLSFKMYYNINGEENPLINYMVNERVVKLRWKKQWYDLVIKNTTKNSDDRSITFICTDTSINELSKIGFNIELNNELYNNQGTNNELARRVLENNTDWILDEYQSETIQQLNEEAVYEVTLADDFTDTVNESSGITTVVTVPSGTKILIYSSQIMNYVNEISSEISIPYFQFARIKDGFTTYKTDGVSQLVTNIDCYSYSGNDLKIIITDAPGFIIKKGNTDLVTETNFWTDLSHNYRAERLVRQKYTILDPLTNKYVDVLNDSNSNNDEIYHYQESVFVEPTAINNLIVNSSGFVSIAGWGATSNDSLTYKIYGGLNGYTSYLELEPDQKVRNYGLSNMSSFIPDGFTKGDKYCLRYKAYYESGEDTYTPSTTAASVLRLHLGNFNNGEIDFPNDYLSEVANSSNSSDFSVFGVDGYVYIVYTFNKSLTLKEILDGTYTKTLNIYRSDAQSELRIYIEDIQFFKCEKGQKPVYDNNGNFIVDMNDSNKVLSNLEYMVPGDMDYLSVGNVIDRYYNHTALLDENGELKEDVTIDSIPYINYQSSFVQKYNDNFEKIRSIEISKSNIFNIIQTIGETFGCWVRFSVEHDSAGATVRKKIYFRKVVGEETGMGFDYGTDLRSISRSIQSDQFVTKIIVPPNSNKYGKDGFCSIGRSGLNYSRANYILNFDYYILHQMISPQVLYRDLYEESNNAIGLYPKLMRSSILYDQLTAEKVQYQKDLDTQQAIYDMNKKGEISETDDINNTVSELEQYLGLGNWYDDAARKEKMKQHKDDDFVTSRLGRLANARESLKKFKSAAKSAQSSIKALKKTISTLDTRMKNRLKEIQKVEKKFQEKYGAFIREGTWSSEEYTNDDLYYLDAQKVAFTSANPQVSYSISVIRLSALEDFKTKVFNIGDITYVQDVDFFGYLYTGDIATPFKEKVLVSEIVSYLDEPDKDVITVQNYRTNFEDLMQKVVATTQALQFAEGSYARAASIIDSSGALTAQALQLSLNANPQIRQVSNAAMMTRTEDGVKVIAPGDASRQSMLTADGVFTSTDGGQTWIKLTGSEGTNTNALVNGVIYPNKIMLMDGTHNTFRWDAKGISAFDIQTRHVLQAGLDEFIPNVQYYETDGAGGYIPVTETSPQLGKQYYTTNDFVNFSKFVRLDRFGLYGIQSEYIRVTWVGETGGNTYIDDRYENGEFYELVDGEYVPVEENTLVDGAIYYRVPKYSFDNPEEIWNSKNVPFQLTWEGFKLQSIGKVNGEAVGSVEISTTDDIRLLKTIGDEDREKIRIGRIYDAEDQNKFLYYGIQIKNDSGVIVFQTDEEGNLTITGTINATAGYFSGEIRAASGIIGGFNIEGNSSSGTGKLTSVAVNANGTNLIELNGSEGTISLGDVVSENGIYLDGVNSEIRGKNFYIGPDISKFNNVEISGKLSSTIFETNKVNAVGGAMIFKPSYKVLEMTKVSETVYKLTLDIDEHSLLYGEVNQYALVSFQTLQNPDNTYRNFSTGNTIVKIISLDEDEGSINITGINADSSATLSDTYSSENQTISNIVILGANGDRIIGINSNDTGIQKLLEGEGLSISTLKIIEKQNEEKLQNVAFYEDNLFLGNLDNIKSTVAPKSLTGFGLYADNVVLRGALTTVNASNGNYAGINTVSDVDVPSYIHEDWDNPGKIVFWGGASGEENSDILAAPFYVTNTGYLFAQKGYFEGSIITKSKLQAVEVETAIIRGSNEESGDFYGLKIIDSNRNNASIHNLGIGFFHEKETAASAEGYIDNLVFSIDEGGLRLPSNLTNLQTPYFISINNQLVEFSGRILNLSKQLHMTSLRSLTGSMVDTGYLNITGTGMYLGKEDGTWLGGVRVYDKGGFIGALTRYGIEDTGLYVQYGKVCLYRGASLIFGNLNISAGDVSPKTGSVEISETENNRGIDIDIY